MNAHQTVFKLYPKAKALIKKAGARHSFRDISLLQQIHDMACELGASCSSYTEQTDLEKKSLIEKHGSHNQKTHGHRHGVGGLRQFAGARGYKVRQVKGKDGKVQYAISGQNSQMRASKLTEAKQLIVSANKFKKEVEKKKKFRQETGFDIGEIIKPADRTGLGFNNAFQSRIIGRRGENFVVKIVNAKPGTIADTLTYLIPIKEAIKV